MPENKNVAALEAKHGEKMIEVRIRFWTDEIAEEPGKVVPKHAWTSGVVHIAANKAHGIVPENPKPFNSLLDVGKIIEAVLIEHGIMLHLERRMKKYVTGD
jgi:hypothetical protein